MIALPGYYSTGYYSTDNTASNAVITKCSQCGCVVKIQVTVYGDPPPIRPQPKAKKLVPRFEPPEPPAYPPVRLTEIVPQNTPRPLPVRKQPRMRAEKQKVELRIQRRKEK